MTGLLELAALAALGLPAGERFDLVLDVVEVAAEELPLWAEDRARTARLLLVWAARESAGRADAVGDAGQACGVLQLHPVARGGATCAELRASRRLGLRRGLAWMRALSARCGSVVGGLRAYASGRCAGTERARLLVAARCALAGGCP